MKQILFSLILMGCWNVSWAQSNNKKILFLGNSYTAYNALPNLISQVSESKGDTIQYSAYNPGGYTFQGHDTSTIVQNYIHNYTWDFVVLQEQSQLPSFPPSQVAQSVYPYAASLCQKIYQKDSCTNIAFYMTWGRKNGDTQNCGSYPPLCTYNGMQQRLKESYMDMAHDNQAWVAPVGVAWKVIRDSFPALELYVADQSHPSITGSYLAACTIYATLFQKTPVGAYFPSSIAPDTALILQQTAAFVVLDSLPNWNIDTSNHAVFQYFIANDGSIQLSNIIPAEQHTWDFGDGTTSLDSLPTHTYTHTGVYTLTHTVQNKCNIDTFSVQINYIVTERTDIEGLPIAIFPNPAQDKLYFKGDIALDKIEIMDTQGRKVNCIKTPFYIDTSSLPHGLYVFKTPSQYKTFTIQR